MFKLKTLIKTNWPYLYVGIAPLVLFAPFLLGRVVLYWGVPLFQFYPWRSFALDVIRSGHLPLWNPYVGNGAPLIANYQSAVFYPPNWIALILPLAYALSWLAVIHLIWAGAGMVNLTRSLGLKPFGQAVAGLAFGMSQFLVTKAADSARASAVAWIPWILWAADRVLLEDTKKALKYSLLLAAFASLQLLAGHAQTTWYTLVLVSVWSLFRIFSHRPVRYRRLFLLAACYLLAAGVASLQLLPTAEFLGQSPRASAYEFEAAMAYSYSPARLLTLFAPDLYGNPARGIFYGYGNYWEDAGYAGLLPLLLVVGLVFSTIKSLFHARPENNKVQPAVYRSLIIFLLILMPVDFILALGSNTPVFPFLYHHVPSFSMFQAPTRWMVWFAFGLALLAGLATDEWQPLQKKSLYWMRLGLVGAVTLTAIGWIAYLLIPNTGQVGMQIHSMARAIGLAGLLLTISTILALTQPALDSGSRMTWIVIVTTFIALDLIYASWGINPAAPPEIYAEASGDIPPVTNGQRVFEYPSDDRQIKYNSLLNFKSFGPSQLAFQVRAAEMANTNILDGVASANDYDPLTERRYSLLMAALDSAHDEKILDLMNVGSVVSFNADNSFLFQQVGGAPSRVWTATNSQVAETQEAALQALFASDFDPSKTVILEADDKGVLAKHSLPTQPTSNLQVSATPQILESTAGDVKIVASLPQDGWIVLSDTYYPGWYVYVDGQPAKLLRADYAFRGVAVPQGQHLVEFRYEPSSFRIGLWITGISTIIFLGLAIGYRKFTH